METIKSYTDLEQSKEHAKICQLKVQICTMTISVQNHEYYPMIMDEQFDDFL